MMILYQSLLLALSRLLPALTRHQIFYWGLLEVYLSCPFWSKNCTHSNGYYKSGEVTFNRSTSYWYTKYFNSLESVFSYALQEFEAFTEIALKSDNELKAFNLSDDQKFLIAHARSYYGSTEWLVENEKPLWLVNEGEYLMINTLDLTIDMAFFELKLNPWTVKNVLEHFVTHYSYEDKIFKPEILISFIMEEFHLLMTWGLGIISVRIAILAMSVAVLTENVSLI